MAHQFVSGPEERLLDALGEVFKLDQKNALAVSKRATCLIANFLADAGALSGSPEAISVALARIHEMQMELEQLSDHLIEYKEVVELRLVHSADIRFRNSKVR